MNFNRVATVALTLLISNIALASGAVDDSCSGYVPTHNESIGLSKASVTFHMLMASEKDNSGFEITKRSDRDSRTPPVSVNIDAKGLRNDNVA